MLYIDKKLEEIWLVWRILFYGGIVLMIELEMFVKYWMVMNIDSYINMFGFFFEDG